MIYNRTYIIRTFYSRTHFRFNYHANKLNYIFGRCFNKLLEQFLIPFKMDRYFKMIEFEKSS